MNTIFDTKFTKIKKEILHVINCGTMVNFDTKISEINSSILKINTINYLQDVNEFVENIDFYEKITENEKKNKLTRNNLDVKIRKNLDRLTNKTDVTFVNLNTKTSPVLV